MSEPRSLLRPALLAAAVVALLAVVALASRSDRPSRPGDPGERTVPVVFWDYLLTLGILVTLAVITLALVVRPTLRRPERRRFGFTQLLAIAICVGLFAYAGTRYEWPQVREEEGNFLVPSSDNAEPTRQGEVQASDRDSRSVRVHWPIVVAGAGLVLLGMGAYVAHRRRARWRGFGLEADAASALAAALDESVDDLRAEPDPRRAVIAAYARMESTLERHGLPRWKAEAPLEYLARVLRELRVRSAAVLALTELFERAKFSRHQIDAEMKEEAIGALLAVRDDLRAPAPGVA